MRHVPPRLSGPLRFLTGVIMRDIFFSYVEEDVDIAEQIAQGLEAVGYTTWHYTRDSLPGVSYLLQTGQAIEQSHAVVLVISPHALGSQQVTREVQRAHECGKPFIPVLRDITHAKFQTRQEEWRQAVGAAVSIPIPPEGASIILSRIIAGLKALDIEPGRSVPADAPGKEILPMPKRVRVAPSRRGARAALKGWVAAGSSIITLALLLWVFFYVNSEPLKPNETTIVIALCTMVVFFVKWCWDRLWQHRSLK